MADHYQKEDATGNIQMEDGLGALLLEQQVGADDLATKLVSLDAMLPQFALPDGAIVISGG